MNKIKFWSMELIFFLTSEIAFFSVLSSISTIAVENAHYTVPEYIKTYVRNEIVAKTIFIFLIISMIYYIFVRKIGLLFVYSWISAISFCLCAEVWLAIDNFYGGTFEGILLLFLTVCAYVVVTLFYIIKFIIKAIKKRRNGLAQQ